MATLGKGATLSYSLTDADYADLGGILDISDLSNKVDITTIERYVYADVTAFKTKWAGNKDSDAITVKIEYIKATCTTVAALLGGTYYFKLTLADSSYWKFQGIVESVASNQAIRENVSNTLKINPTTLPAFTAA